MATGKLCGKKNMSSQTLIRPHAQVVEALLLEYPINGYKGVLWGYLGLYRSLTIQ